MRPPSRLVLLGHPVGHSLSPIFQNAALRAAAIDVAYVALDVAPDRLPETLRTLRREGAAGNVTVPHKVATYELCDLLTAPARSVGAVNTFWVADGVLHGDNTDVGGFDAAIRQLLGVPKPDTRVALLGAGGAAAAVATATRAWNGATLTIWNRTPARAHALAQHFDHARVEVNAARAVEDADLVINATSTGLYDDNYPIALALLPPRSVVFDVVYRRGETAWVRAARATGHPAADGIGMLIEQGALAFRRWFGIAPNRDVMWRSVTDDATAH